MIGFDNRECLDKIRDVKLLHFERRQVAKVLKIDNNF